MGRKPTLENEILNVMLNYKKRKTIPTFSEIKDGYSEFFNKPLSDGALNPTLQKLMLKGRIQRKIIPRKGSIRGEIVYQLSSEYFNTKLKSELAAIIGNPNLKMDLRVLTPIIGVNTIASFNESEINKVSYLGIKQFSQKLFSIIDYDAEQTLARTPLLLAWAGKQIGNLAFITKKEARKKLSKPYEQSFANFLKCIQTEDGEAILMIRGGQWLKTALEVFGFQKEIEKITENQSTYAWLRLFDYIVGAAFFCDKGYKDKLSYNHPTLVELENFLTEKHASIAGFLDKAKDIKFMLIVYFGFSEIDDTEPLEEIDHFEEWLDYLKRGDCDDNLEIFNEGLANVQKIRKYVQKYENKLKDNPKNPNFPSEFMELYVDWVKLWFLLKYHSEGTSLDFWVNLEKALQDRKILIDKGKGKTTEEICEEIQKAVDEELKEEVGEEAFIKIKKQRIDLGKIRDEDFTEQL